MKPIALKPVSTVTESGRWALLGASRWWHRLALAFTLVATFAPMADAALPPEVFFKPPTVLSARLSPSGQQMAITTTREGGRAALVVIDLSPGYKSRWVVKLDDFDVVQFEWVGDDRLVFGVTNLAAGSGADYTAGAGLFAVKVDGSELLEVVRRSSPIPGSARDRSLTPNHQLLHIPEPAPDNPVPEIIVGRFEEDGSVVPLTVNLLNGRSRPVEVDGAPSDARRWLFDRRGRAVAVSTSSGNRQAQWVRGRDGKGWIRIHEGSALEPGLALNAVGQDGSIFVTHPHGPEGESVLSRFDLERLAPHSEPLVRSPGFDFEGQVLFQRGQPMGVRLTTDAESTVWFNPSMKAFQDEVDKRLPGRVNRITCRRCGTPDMRALIFSYSDQDPGRYWLHDAREGVWQLVSEVREGIDPTRMAQVDFHVVKARDGRSIPVWVTMPPGHQKGQAAPAVVLVHGGPWVRGGRWAWTPWEQFLASRGYTVISPEFRGSTGFGHEHFKAGWKQWGQAMQDDVADALQWARREGLAGGQACIAGASYGGYATFMGLIRHPELYRCGVAWVAVTDLLLLVQGSWRVLDDVGPQARRHGIPTLVGDGKADEAMLRAHSPVEQAARVQAPVLMGFGEEDLRVPLAHGQRMREALRAAGRNPEWVSYPGEGHSWRQVKTNVDFAQRMERFLAQHLKP